MIDYALFFASLKRRARRKSIGLTLFFERKIYDFPFKKQRRSDRFSPRTPFERSDERIPRHQAKGMRNSAYQNGFYLGVFKHIFFIREKL